MSRDPYRSSTGSLHGGGGGGGRWDTERFYRERDRYERGRANERDRYEDEYGRRLSGGFDDGDRVGIRAQASIGGRFATGRAGDLDRFGSPSPPPPPPAAGRGRFEETRVQVVHEEDRRERDRRNPIFLDEHVPTNRAALVPYNAEPQRSRRKSVHVEREYVAPAPAPRGPPPRPTFIRRQSSLDTFDRRPMPRYGDREDHLQVVTVPTPPRRRRSPPRREIERDYEEVRIIDPDVHVHHMHHDHMDDDHFHHIHHDHIEYPGDVRERERTTRSYRFRVEDEVPEAPPVRRGKTRMPRRLVEKTAIDMLGYPFEEEIDHIVILLPLNKDQIDELVGMSKQMRVERTKVVEEVRMIETVPPPPPPPPPPQPIQRTEIIVAPPEPPPIEFVREVIKTEEIAPQLLPPPPPPMQAMAALSVSGASARSDRRSSRSKKRRSKSTRRASSSSSSSSTEIIHKRIEESGPVSGPFTGMLGGSGFKDERSIKNEIKALEIEEKVIKLEREKEREVRRAERIRDSSRRSKSVGRVDVSDGIKVERNKKEPNPRLIKAMLATLT